MAKKKTARKTPKKKETLQKLNIELDQSLTVSKSLLMENIDQLRLMQEAIAKLGEGIVITDNEIDWPGPQILFVNEAMCRITGYCKEELLGKTPRMLQGPDTDRNVVDQIKADLAAGRSSAAELTNYRKDGGRYDAELFITPLFDDAGLRTNFIAIHRDITARKQADERAQRSDDRIQALTKATSDAVYCMSADWTVMLDLHGREFIPDTHKPSRKWLDRYIHPDDQDFVWKSIQQAIAARSIFELEHRVIRVDGTIGWVHSRAIPVFDEEGRLVEWFGAATDISPRKQAEQALRDREERLRSILNTASDAIINIDGEGTIIELNPAAQDMFGYARDELIGKNVKILMPPPYRNDHDDYLKRYRDTGVARIIGSGREVAGCRKDGSTFPAELTVDEVDHLGIFTGVLRDVTERRQLQRVVLEAVEEEQRRIGQDMHDSTQQELVGLGMLTQTLLSMLSRQTDHPPDAIRERQCALARKIADGIARTHRDLQSIARGLVPIRLDQQGIVAALRELALQTDQLDGITCAFKCERPAETTDVQIATNLFRIVQEALANALKHAQANHILISLDYCDGQCVLCVADDGVGFDPAEAGKGMGLKTMAYRASLIGAMLRIDPVESGGTVVTCEIKCQEP